MSSPFTEVIHAQRLMKHSGRPQPALPSPHRSPSSALTTGADVLLVGKGEEQPFQTKAPCGNTKAFRSYMICDKSLNLSKPGFLYLQNVAKDICFRGLLLWLR